MKPATSRSAAIDALRVVGTSTIVVGHTWDARFLRESIYSLHVPIFFYLTGYLWWARVRNPGAEAKNRARTLLLPYLVWLALITVLAFAVRAQPRGLNLTALQPILLGGRHVGKPYSAHWSVTARFVVAVVHRIVELGPRWLPWASAALQFAVAYSAQGVLAAIPESIGTALACLVFVLAGVLIRHSRGRITRPVVTGALLPAASVALLAAGLSAPVDLKGADFETPILSVAVAITISVDRHIRSGFTRLAEVSLMAILTHSAVFWLMRTPTRIDRPTARTGRVAHDGP